MSSHRLDRVRNLLRQTISELLTQVKDPRVGFVTVTDVEVSPDLRHAKVFVSVMGTPDERAQALKGLESARGFLRRELHGAVSLRYIPELAFLLDDSLDRGLHMNALLEKAKAQSAAAATAVSEGEEKA
jgi:ribosome-binding factor A